MPTNALYREITLQINTGYDSGLTSGSPAKKIKLTQNADREEYRRTFSVGASDEEVEVDTGIANIKSLTISADYPIMYRLNGGDETQFVMNTNDVSNISCGQAALDVCFYSSTSNITAIFIAPIESAAQSARVTIIATGDPLTNY